MRSLANEIIRFLRDRCQLPEGASIVLVIQGMELTMRPIDEVHYAIEAEGNVVVGKLGVEGVSRLFRRRQFVLFDHRSCVVPVSKVDRAALGFVDDLTGVAEEPSDDDFPRWRTDNPAPWICRVRRGVLELIPERKCEKDRRLLGFALAFCRVVTERVGD